MRRLPKQLSLLAVSVFAAGVVSVAPVYAMSGHDDGTTSTTTVKTADSTSESTSGSSGSTSSGSRTKVETASSETKTSENKTEVEKTNAGDLREEAHKLLSEKRQEKKTKSVEERQKACEAHKTELTKRSENYSRHAKRHLDTFTDVYNKVLAFQADKKLTAANFNTLKAAADAKKAAAETAVATLSDSNVTVDCSAPDPAVNVATLKTTVASTRTALQEYRAAIKDVIVALQSAKSSANTTNPTSTERN